MNVTVAEITGWRAEARAGRVRFLRIERPGELREVAPEQVPSVARDELTIALARVESEVA
jgi:hypothetical protein